ncbi:unnamed protein product [Linum trigynum]|uniref:Uncharacterized protein n=1 Tax=Linum trigynum TaxID=586398 RepID=A0AAV2DYV4_9ROSI
MEQDQMATLNNPSDECIEVERKISLEYMELKKAEELYYKQKSRVQVIKEGDSNTSFFHKMVKVMTQRQQITRMMNEQGEMVTDIQQVGAIAVDFYTKLIGTEDPHMEHHSVKFYQGILQHRLTTDDGALLMQGITRA